MVVTRTWALHGEDAPEGVVELGGVANYNANAKGREQSGQK